MTLKDLGKLRIGVGRTLSAEETKELGDLVLSRAIELSKGTVSTRELSRNPLNHPYGRGEKDYRGRIRGAIPYGDPGVINEQEGEFVAGWSIEYSETGFTLRNTSHQAMDLIAGTKTAVPRPILQKIHEDVISPFCSQKRIRYRLSTNVYNINFITS